MRSNITSVQTAREVSALLAAPNSRIIAGGTSTSPDPGEELHLVDISGLEGLDGLPPLPEAGHIDNDPDDMTETTDEIIL